MWLFASCTAVHPEAPRVTEVVVVLGNRPPLAADGRVGQETALRVAAGVEAYRRGRGERLLMVGGPAPRGGTEAAVMAREARRLGVPTSALWMEDRSTNTIENARNTLAILCADRPSPCRPRITLVTSDYHMDRAARLFRCAGAEVAPYPAAMPFSRLQRFGIRMREAMTRFAYLFSDECARAAGRR